MCKFRGRPSDKAPGGSNTVNSEGQGCFLALRNERFWAFLEFIRAIMNVLSVGKGELV